jgi:hypothetical protein
MHSGGHPQRLPAGLCRRSSTDMARVYARFVKPYAETKAQARTVRRAMGSDGFPLHAGKLDQSGVCAWRAAAHTCPHRHERASV